MLDNSKFLGEDSIISNKKELPDTQIIEEIDNVISVVQLLVKKFIIYYYFYFSDISEYLKCDCDDLYKTIGTIRRLLDKLENKIEQIETKRKREDETKE